MRILMAASEGVPFSKTGGLADVVGALPRAIAGLGHEVAVVLPLHRRKTHLKESKTVLRSLTIPLGKHLHFPSVVEGPTENGVRYLFVDYPPYFDRDELYGTPVAGDYPDNAERFSLFSRAVLEIAKLVFPPDVLHCHDWQTALVPVMLSTVYADDPALKDVGTLFTIHNLGYQGQFPPSVLDSIGLSWDLFTIERLEFYGRVNFLKGGLIYSDFLNTVSRKYAAEIQTPEYGAGLEGVTRKRAAVLAGIVNGVDYAEWNPATDKLIAANYTPDKLAGKMACKKDLLAQFKLPADDLNRPLIGIVSRFTAQKGADLIADAADALARENFYLVALGTGDAQYEALFKHLAAQYPEKIAVRIAYDNTLAHKIEAGADMFLMPSRYEPCGLNQIYSLKYGTVPVVRATGGLDDTIQPWDAAAGTGTGFKFADYASSELLAVVREALAAFGDQASWRRLMRNGMAQDYSWDASAREYGKLYQKILGMEQAATT
jgi:starch synthase